MRLMQIQNKRTRFVAVRDEEGQLRLLHTVGTVYDLAVMAANKKASLREIIANHIGAAVDENRLLAEARILPPITHPDAARLMVSGTGLTHISSAQARDHMHLTATVTDDKPTDSMRMFQWGVAGGKPADGVFFGAQPEWFYKGDGNSVVPPGADIIRPAFAKDGGEEPEIAGVYIINHEGLPCRIGFALGNEFSDHVMEKQNYLWLAHSKLRQCALAPELMIGELVPEIHGVSAIRRHGKTIWQKDFFSGEAHMCHSIANIQRHHFKYLSFCRPGDVHVHFFGTATLSYADHMQVEDGDEFVIHCDDFGMPLLNRLRLEKTARQTEVMVL